MFKCSICTAYLFFRTYSNFRTFLYSVISAIYKLDKCFVYNNVEICYTVLYLCLSRIIAQTFLVYKLLTTKLPYLVFPLKYCAFIIFTVVFLF